MKIAAFDIGKKYIGIAVTDESGIIAQPLLTYRRKSLKSDLEYFDNFVKTYKIEKIVLGYPLSFDDSENEMSRFVKKFYYKIRERWGIPVVLWDERYSTDEAEAILRMYNKKKLSNKKTLKDQIAAAIILKNYLDNSI